MEKYLAAQDDKNIYSYGARTDIERFFFVSIFLCVLIFPNKQQRGLKKRNGAGAILLFTSYRCSRTEATIVLPIKMANFFKQRERGDALCSSAKPPGGKMNNLSKTWPLLYVTSVELQEFPYSTVSVFRTTNRPEWLVQKVSILATITKVGIEIEVFHLGKSGDTQSIILWRTIAA